MKRFAIFIISLTAFACQTNTDQPLSNPEEYVSTLVGTASDYQLSTGNTYPAIALPWGMNFWTPQTGTMGDGWVYTYSAHTICGFKQTHQPSPWINDYGQFSIMPIRGQGLIDENSRKSWFSHLSEIARPYYYKVYLADFDVVAEITPTERCALMQFTFSESNESGIVIDAYDHGSSIRVGEDGTIYGVSTRNSGGVTENFASYFVIRFDKPIDRYSLIVDNKEVQDSLANGNHAQAAFYFTTSRGEKITAQVASSFISHEQALQNLRAEVADATFEQVLSSAKSRWNEVLGAIEVCGGTEEQYRTFYSCLYRSTLFPRKLWEVDAKGNIVHYSPYNGKVCSGYLYGDTGFWDTFRALFPLLNLVYPSENAKIQAGLANAYRESGLLPEWSSPGHRDCMVGNNSASVVADAILKDITPKEDIPTLYQAIMKGRITEHETISSSGRKGYQYYNTLGYIPYNVGINENVARTLEYSYDDWCIARVAEKLGKVEESKIVDKASKNYKNLFDPTTHLMRGRNSDGTFAEPFSPYKWGDAYTEGNAWHYTWSVFHDIDGLATLMGGKEEAAKMVDSLFVVPPIYDDSYYGYRIHEITEMQVANMGNYAHGNQPAQHIPYLYDYFDQPRKCQFWCREIMDRLYRSSADGYCGDEDNGQTSAWYVFSALGFYPVCPGSDSYAIGSPLFRKATINLENGNKILLSAPNNSQNNRYIISITEDAEPLAKPFLSYSKIIQGTTIKFEMGQ